MKLIKTNWPPLQTVVQFGTLGLCTKKTWLINLPFLFPIGLRFSTTDLGLPKHGLMVDFWGLRLPCFVHLLWLHVTQHLPETMVWSFMSMGIPVNHPPIQWFNLRLSGTQTWLNSTSEVRGLSRLSNDHNGRQVLPYSSDESSHYSINYSHIMTYPS